jgi:hypothetical protein
MEEGVEFYSTPFVFIGGHSFHIRKVHPKNIQYKIMKNCIGKSQ